MFAELYVENLALIEQATLSWDKGLNVLSGETGAGKSMVIGAVSLLLGAKGSKDIVRKDAQMCLVQGVFQAPFPPAVVAKLKSENFLVDEDEPLILTREILASGKSAAKINGRQVPLQTFKDISRLLVNIHGQMEHISLLEPENQMELLDSFGGKPHYEALDAVALSFESWQAKLKDIRDIAKKNKDNAERKRLLEFQISELEAANLKVGEEEELEQELTVLGNAQFLSQKANAAYQGINGGQKSTLSAILSAQEDVAKLAEVDKTWEPLAVRLNDAYYELEDIAMEIRHGRDMVEENPARLEDVNSRLHDLKQLAKKYLADVPQLLEILESSRIELDQQENQADFLAKLKKEAAELEKLYQNDAAVLTKIRKATGKILGDKITEELHYLKMEQATFAIEIVAAPATAQGVDEVCFMIDPNPGEGMKPVAKIASGGEMSRIMLAIKVILAELDQVGTLIFDEIDTGLGGKALVSVADKLVEIGKYTQAICVTHAPVLAAYANHNLQVAKAQFENRTITKVHILTAEEKVEELSRMLAGDKVTDTTTKQAIELIEQGKAL